MGKRRPSTKTPADKEERRILVEQITRLHKESASAKSLYETKHWDPRNQTWAFEPTVQERRRALSEALRKAWGGTAVLRLTRGQEAGIVSGTARLTRKS